MTRETSETAGLGWRATLVAPEPPDGRPLSNTAEVSEPPGLPPVDQDAPMSGRPRERRLHRTAGARNLAWPIAVGLIVRYALAPFTGWNRDLGVWVRASETGAYHLSVYARPDFSYPSGWGNVLQALGVLLPRLGLPASSFATRSTTMAPLAGLNHFSIFITSPWFNVAFKSVLFAFDLGTALLLFALVLQMTGDERRARLAFMLFFLNPFVIFLSAVLGEFDVIVGFCVLLGVYCVLNHRYVLAGAAIGLGVVVKASPLFVVPVLLCAIVLDSRAASPKRRAGAGVGRFLAGGIGVGAVCAVPALLTHSLSTMVSLTSARETSAPVSGGFSFYGLEVFKHMSWAKTWVATNPTLAHAISDVVPLLVALIGIVWLLRRGLTPPLLVIVIAGELAALLLAAPQTQPQYLIWVLPLVVALAVGCRIGKFELVTISVSAIILFAFVYGPDAFVFPLAAFTSLVPLHSLTSGVLAWIADDRQGIWAVRATEIPNSVVVVFVIAAELVLIGRALLAGRPGQIRTADLADTGDGPGHDARARRTAAVAVASAQLLVAGMLAAALLVVVFVGSGSPSGSVRLVSGTVKDGSLQTVIQLSPGAGQRSLRLVAFPVRSAPVPLRHLYVFYDGAYPERGGSTLISSTIAARLSDELKLRAGHLPVSAVDAPQLTQVFGDTKSAAGSVVVDITGMLPSSSYGASVDLVKPWLDSGGVLLWGGATIGQYFAVPGARSGEIVAQLPSAQVQCILSCVASVTSATSECLVPSTGARACGPTSSSPTGPVAPLATAAGAALEISYRTAVPPQSLIGVVSGGRNLGWSGSGGSSSVTTVAVGAGAVVVFGGPVNENQDITQDMASILLSHAYDISGPLSWTTVPTSRFAAAKGSLPWSVKLPASAATSPTPVEVFAMDPNVFGTLTASWTVPAPH